MARSKGRRVFFLMCSLLVPAIACNAIIGLDDYQKAQCDNRVCDGGIDSNFDALQPDAPNDQSTTDVRVDAPGAKPVSWARFLMPNYDGGGSTENLHKYQASGNQVVDQISGRTWLQTAQPELKKYADAVKACDEAPGFDKGTWRLPSRIELVTLLDLTRGPTIDPIFTGTASASTWTSSEVRIVRPDGTVGVTSPLKYWVVDFSSGELKQLDEPQSAAVRCVRAK